MLRPALATTPSSELCIGHPACEVNKVLADLDHAILRLSAFDVVTIAPKLGALQICITRLPRCVAMSQNNVELYLQLNIGS